MDERIEWQLRWLEEAVARVVREMTVLAGMMPDRPDLSMPLEDIVLVLDKRLRMLREALGPKQVAPEAEAAAAAIPAAEMTPAEAGPAESKPEPKNYRIENRATHESDIVLAGSAQEACQKMGWQIGDCYVKEMKPEKEEKGEAEEVRP